MQISDFSPVPTKWTGKVGKAMRAVSKVPSSSFWLAKQMDSSLVDVAKSTEDNITIFTPFEWSTFIASIASASLLIEHPDSNCASNWKKMC